MSYLLALDQGTSSSRSIVFKPDGSVLAVAQQEIRQIYPRPGWVEHDPQDIWSSQLATARQALQQAGVSASQVASPTSARPPWSGDATRDKPFTTPSFGKTGAPNPNACACAKPVPRLWCSKKPAC